MSNDKLVKDGIMRRLDAIIALLANIPNRNLHDTIVSLHNAGMRPIEIAAILGKSQKYVNKELTLERRKSGAR